VRALDRLLVLDKGRIAEEGSHEKLIQIENGYYRRLFERQALGLMKEPGDIGDARLSGELASDFLIDPAT
jgi:ATP-binding cassette, subfamily B, bacterial